MLPDRTRQRTPASRCCFNWRTSWSPSLTFGLGAIECSNHIMEKHITPLIAASCLFLMGCASTQQFVPFPEQTKTVEDSNKGRIYVMRPATFGAGISMDVSDGGIIIGSTGPHGFLCWEREPGQTVISSKAENTSAVNLPVKAGQVHYIFQHLRLGLVMARNEMEIVSEEEGKKVLKQCSPPKLLK